MKNSDGSKYLKFDNTDFTVAAGNFSVDASGDITANGDMLGATILLIPFVGSIKICF